MIPNLCQKNVGFRLTHARLQLSLYQSLQRLNDWLIN